MHALFLVLILQVVGTTVQEPIEVVVTNGAATGTEENMRQLGTPKPNLEAAPPNRRGLGPVSNQPLEVTTGIVPSDVVVMLGRIPVETITGFRLSGRVTGDLKAAPFPLRLGMNGTSTEPQLTEVIANPDGTFEFPKVQPGTYNLQLMNAVGGKNPIRIRVNVATQDVSGVELPLPAELFAVPQ